MLCFGSERGIPKGIFRFVASLVLEKLSENAFSRSRLLSVDCHYSVLTDQPTNDVQPFHENE